MLIADYMTNDHRQCDEDFVAAESAVSEDNWELVTTAVFEDYFPHTSNED